MQKWCEKGRRDVEDPACADGVEQAEGTKKNDERCVKERVEEPEERAMERVAVERIVGGASDAIERIAGDKSYQVARRRKEGGESSGRHHGERRRKQREKARGRRGRKCAEG